MQMRSRKAGRKEGRREEKKGNEWNEWNPMLALR
jgi:hypothetical protein